MKKYVVSFVTDDRSYPDGIYRIEESLKKQCFDGVFLYWIVTHGTFPAGCPSHLSAPYAFKLWCIAEAQRRGADLVLWLDSSIIPTNIDAVFAKIADQGSYFVRRLRQELDSKAVGQACSDEALAAMGLTREEAMGLPQISASRVGLDLRNAQASRFFELWREKSLDGVSFKGYSGKPDPEKSRKMHSNLEHFTSRYPGVLGHRHDQSIASILIHQLGLPWALESEDELVIDKSYVKRKRFGDLFHKKRRRLSRYLRGKRS